MRRLQFALIALGLLSLPGCLTKTVDEMSYTEQKALAGQILKRCQDQSVPEAEMQACVNVEAKREAAVRFRRAQRADAIAASEAGKNTYCQAIGNAVQCY